MCVCIQRLFSIVVCVSSLKVLLSVTHTPIQFSSHSISYNKILYIYSKKNVLLLVASPIDMIIFFVNCLLFFPGHNQSDYSYSSDLKLSTFNRNGSNSMKNVYFLFACWIKYEPDKLIKVSGMTSHVLVCHAYVTSSVRMWMRQLDRINTVI